MGMVCMQYLRTYRISQACALLCLPGARVTEVACQFSRPEAEQGFIQAFRRAKGDAKATKLKLQGLEIGAKYEIENLDGGKQTRTDRGLLEQGLAVNFPAAPAALLYGPISVSEVPASSAGVADRSDTPIKGTMEAKAERTTLDNARACAMESTA